MTWKYDKQSGVTMEFRLGGEMVPGGKPSHMQEDFIAKFLEDIREKFMREAPMWGFTDPDEAISMLASIASNLFMVPFSLMSRDASLEEVLSIYDTVVAQTRKVMEEGIKRDAHARSVLDSSSDAGQS
jgi:hypothetical protein